MAVPALRRWRFPGTSAGSSTAASSDTKSAADTSGEYLEMEWFLPPSTETPPKHDHPQQREDYDALDGAFEVVVRDGWQIVRARESASAPVGEVHTFRVGD
jgi:quercetin dioxygenase-like cupin family protein